MSTTAQGTADAWLPGFQLWLCHNTAHSAFPANPRNTKVNFVFDASEAAAAAQQLSPTHETNLPPHSPQTMWAAGGDSHPQSCDTEQPRPGKHEAHPPCSGPGTLCFDPNVLVCVYEENTELALPDPACHATWDQSPPWRTAVLGCLHPGASLVKWT